MEKETAKPLRPRRAEPCLQLVECNRPARMAGLSGRIHLSDHHRGHPIGLNVLCSGRLNRGGGDGSDRLGPAHQTFEGPKRAVSIA